MAIDHAERRLVAVLAIDIVGYSRLVEADEANTLAAIRTLRHEVIDPLITEYHGRIVKSMGDGAIIEFSSVVDAVSCAVTAQCSLLRRQVEIPPGNRILYRMGINLGDVVVDGEDLLGDGVNVAARLEQLSEAGGVLISGTAFDHLQGKVALPLEFIGKQHVKNISKPVRTYRVRFQGAPRPRSRWHLNKALGYAVGVVILLVAIAAASWLFYPWTARLLTATTEQHALRLPDRPSIAVMPLENLSADPSQAYFADGITEDLLTDLSKLSGIFVTSRNSSFAYKGKPVKLRQVAEELGVQYVLEGSVRRQDDRVRINVQLVDAIGDHHIWADRYDMSMKDVFELQDKVIGQIISALAVKITSNERGEAGTVETLDPKAYDLVLQGMSHLRAGSEEETLAAIPYLEQAIKLDPDYSRAHSGLAAANWRIASSNWESANRVFEKAMEDVYSNLSIAMHKPDPLAYSISAEVMAKQGHYEEAFANISKAVELAPNNPENFISKARILNATGRAPEAEEAVHIAMRLDPQSPPGYLRTLAISLFHQERYEEALKTFNVVVARQSDVGEDYVTIISSLGHLGRVDGVREIVDKYNELSVTAGYFPLTVQEMGWWWYGDVFDYDRSYIARLQEGLRMAGVPEGAGTDLAYSDYARFVSKTNGEYNVAGATKIDAPTAKRLHDSGIKLFDVRSSLSYERSHAAGAISLPVLSSMTREALAKLADKNEGVIFACHGKYCPDSAFASAKALVWGYKTVYHFAGGFPAWEDAHYPVEVDLSRDRN